MRRVPSPCSSPSRASRLIDTDGQVFHDPAADAALFEALRENLHDDVEVRELDTHINDPAFARAMAERLHELYTAWAGDREGESR